MTDSIVPAQGGTKSAMLRAYLLALIDGGLRPHDKLPTERELAEAFGVARLTARRALDQLGQEGHVYRTQGAGTFVSEPRIARSLELTSFSDDMRARGLVPGSLPAEVAEVPAGADVGARLGISPRDRVTHVHRVRTADGEPMCIEHSYIPVALAPGLVDRQVTGSLSELMSGVYHLRATKAEQSISATVLEPDVAKRLGVPEFSPAFKVQRVAFDARDRRIEYAESIYRADRYSYDFVIYRSAREHKP
jgi:GntR family transcriptional regulator